MSLAKRKLAAGAAGLAVLAGTGGAYAATKSSTATPPDPATEQKAFLDDLAKRLNVPRDQLDAAIKGAASDRIDAAVAAGKLTKEEGDAAKKRIESGTGVPLLGAGPIFRGGGPGRPGGPGRQWGIGPLQSFDAAAKFLGLTEAELRTQLSSGKSLADVAKDKGKSVDDLKAAIKAELTANLDQAVKDGKLTDTERTNFLKDIDARLDDIVNATPPKGPGLHRFRIR
jgi:polyhydroxyalkanoate synthesis regulator phasin